MKRVVRFDVGEAVADAQKSAPTAFVDFRRRRLLANQRRVYGGRRKLGDERVNFGCMRLKVGR